MTVEIVPSKSFVIAEAIKEMGLTEAAEGRS